MTVVAINELKGDTKELLSKYDKVNAQLRAQPEPPPGLLIHTCVELPDGIRIANVWESEQQALTAFRSEQFQSALRSAGIEPTQPAIFPAHNHINFAAAQSAVR